MNTSVLTPLLVCGHLPLFAEWCCNVESQALASAIRCFHSSRWRLIHPSNTSPPGAVQKARNGRGLWGPSVPGALSFYAFPRTRSSLLYRYGCIKFGHTTHLLRGLVLFDVPWKLGANGERQQQRVVQLRRLVHVHGGNRTFEQSIRIRYMKAQLRLAGGRRKPGRHGFNSDTPRGGRALPLGMGETFV